MVVMVVGVKDVLAVDDRGRAWSSWLLTTLRFLIDVDVHISSPDTGFPPYARDGRDVTLEARFLNLFSGEVLSDEQFMRQVGGHGRQTFTIIPSTCTTASASGHAFCETIPGDSCCGAEKVVLQRRWYGKGVQVRLDFEASKSTPCQASLAIVSPILHLTCICCSLTLSFRN